jgi:hypothetical protein
VYRAAVRRRAEEQASQDTLFAMLSKLRSDGRILPIAQENFLNMPSVKVHCARVLSLGACMHLMLFVDRMAKRLSATCVSLRALPLTLSSSCHASMRFAALACCSWFNKVLQMHQSMFSTKMCCPY